MLQDKLFPIFLITPKCGSGFGALAASIGRVINSFSIQITLCELATARNFGREFLMSAAPELIDVAVKQKSPKRFIQTRTAREQLCGGRR